MPILLLNQLRVSNIQYSNPTMSTTDPSGGGGKSYQVAVILFAGADLLDFACPVGILSDIEIPRPSSSSSSSTGNEAKAGSTAPAFKIHHLARDRHAAISIGASKTSIHADMSFDEALEQDRLDEFDMLVVPGGPVDLIESMARAADGPEIEFIKRFAATGAAAAVQRRAGEKEGGKQEERMAFSICNGSLLLAAAGMLSHLQATSHHACLRILQDLDSSIEVIDSTAGGRARRYVDGGVNGAGIRVVTAGGVTCGLDAGLYVVELKVGRRAADDWAVQNEYVWNRVS